MPKAPRPVPLGLSRLRAALQTTRRRLGLDDATYYSLLGTTTGRPITSTTELTTAEAARALDQLRGNQRHEAGRGASSAAAMRGKLRDLLTGTAGADGQPVTEAYAEAILCRQRGLPRGTACPLDMANATELRGLIAAIQRQRKRGA